MRLQDTEDLVSYKNLSAPISQYPTTHFLYQSISIAHTRNNLNLSNSMRVTEDDTDLRRSRTLTGELADLVDNRLGSGLEPWRGLATVWDGGSWDTLSLRVETTHCEVVEVVVVLWLSFGEFAVSLAAATAVVVVVVNGFSQDREFAIVMWIAAWHLCVWRRVLPYLLDFRVKIALKFYIYTNYASFQP